MIQSILLYFSGKRHSLTDYVNRSGLELLLEVPTRLPSGLLSHANVTIAEPGETAVHCTPPHFLDLAWVVNPRHA